MRTILLGAAGTGTAFAAATAIRRVWSGKVRIILADINPAHLVTTSILGDLYLQVPPSSAPDFSPTIEQILEDQCADAYLPLLPAEMLAAGKMVRSGRVPGGLQLLSGCPSQPELASDKWLISEWLAAHDIPTPVTALASVPFSSSEYFLKPRHGNGSRGARKINRADLPSSLGANLEDWILQEVAQSPEVTVDAFYDPTAGFCSALCRERLEVKAGVSTKARLFHDDSLSAFARTIGEELPFAGSFCFQVMWLRRGWVVTDLNLRPGAGTAMGVPSRNDFFAAMFARAWGEDYARFFNRLEKEIFVTRQFADFITGFG